MRKCIFVLLALSLFGGEMNGQTLRSKSVDHSSKITQHMDSVTAAFDASLSKAAMKSLTTSDSLNVSLSPYLYRLVGQGMYYSSSVRNQFNIDWNNELCENQGQFGESASIKYRDELNTGVDALLLTSYLSSPEHYTYYDSQLANETVIDAPSYAESQPEQLINILDEAKGIKEVTEIVDDIDVNLQVTKPNFWKTDGKFSLQFTQNYFSQTWYKGGENNGSMLSTLYLSANYNDQKLIQWDNSLDMKLGFMTAPSDTIHDYLTNTDKINLNSKVGIKATKSAWFYTFSMQAFTQFMPGYKANKREVFSKFLAPLDVNASIGMDYKPKLKKKDWSLSLALLPLSYKLRYIGSDDDAHTIHSSYNMKNDNGEWITTKHDFGSRLEYGHNFKLLSNLSWRSRLYYYTTYKYSEAEFENTFSFSFNKYLSADFYTLWRFDDNRPVSYKDSSLGYFQFREYLTFGLSYSF